ncbi:hypothetical protein QFX71_000698 [Citrobacter amalonaticus]|uniref:hypothetical protein n=1 Tax=Citrobacter amalonaticus TaxID=35703 RepID=UPI0025A6A975|nr:hypothetical protein [Citrobacter amalonaticus]EKY5001826.1 hypothetical protein [Citrobacter amalonaticus]
MSKELLPFFSALLSFIALFVSITALYNTYRTRKNAEHDSLRKMKIDTVKELREVELVYRGICSDTEELIKSIEMSTTMNPHGKKELLKGVRDNLGFFTLNKQGVTNMISKLDENFKSISREDIENIAQFTAFEANRLAENGKIIKERFKDLKEMISRAPINKC